MIPASPDPKRSSNRERVFESFINRVTEDGEEAHFAAGAGFAFAVEVELGAGMIEHGGPVGMRELKYDLEKWANEGTVELMKTKTKAVSAKTKARRLIDKLPASASWDDVMQQIFVRQKIEAGLADLDAGRRHSHASIKREFGLA